MILPSSLPPSSPARRLFGPGAPAAPTLLLCGLLALLLLAAPVAAAARGASSSRGAKKPGKSQAPASPAKPQPAKKSPAPSAPQAPAAVQGGASDEDDAKVIAADEEVGFVFEVRLDAEPEEGAPAIVAVPVAALPIADASGPGTVEAAEAQGAEQSFEPEVGEPELEAFAADGEDAAAEADLAPAADEDTGVSAEPAEPLEITEATEADAEAGAITAEEAATEPGSPEAEAGEAGEAEPPPEAISEDASAAPADEAPPFHLK